MSLESVVDEHNIKTVRAMRLSNLPIGYGGVGGRLQLTNRRILFTPHWWLRFNESLWSRLLDSPSIPAFQPLEIPLRDVSKVDATDLSLVANHAISIETVGAESYRFKLNPGQVGDTIAIIRRYAPAAVEGDAEHYE